MRTKNFVALFLSMLMLFGILGSSITTVSAKHPPIFGEDTTLSVSKTIDVKKVFSFSSYKFRNLKYTSDNTKIATVSNNTIKAVSKGIAVIKVTGEYYIGNKWEKTTRTARITVKQPVTKIALNTYSLNWKVGKTGTFKVSVAPSTANNKAVTWKSSNTKVATINANGTVKAVGKGTATLTCTAKDGSKKTASCRITVKQPVTKIALNTYSLNWKVGKTGTFKVTTFPSNANNKSVAWKSSNTKVATINANGTVKAVGKGTATLTCTAKDGSKKTATCKITVK